MSAQAALPAVADIVIAGAGICGLSTARYLSRTLPSSSTILLVSSHAPASYTSSLSTECYRDHWPSDIMRKFMHRSIDLIHQHAKETNDAFRVQNRGYLYVSKEKEAVTNLQNEAFLCHGEERTRIQSSLNHASSTDYFAHQTGADVITDNSTLRSYYPFLSTDITGSLHARNAGWISAQTMGSCMMDELLTLTTPDGRPRVKLVKGDITSVLTTSSTDNKPLAVKGITIKPSSSSSSIVHTIKCGTFVNSTGPYLNHTHLSFFRHYNPNETVLTKSGLPVFSEVHSKVVFRDTLGIIPREAPMTISNDYIKPAFEPEEIEYIAEVKGQKYADKLMKGLSPGVHFRPYGGKDSNAVLMLWEDWHHGIQPTEPPSESVEHLLDHEFYPEVVLRGLATIIPDLQVYFQEEYKNAWLKNQQQQQQQNSSISVSTGEKDTAASMEQKKPYVDGGYYTKTIENIPLIGPAPNMEGNGIINNAYICGAVSGYGIMAGHGAGELLAQHVYHGTANNSSSSGSNENKGLPSYAKIMNPLRYQSKEFIQPGGIRDQLLASGGGQL